MNDQLTGLMFWMTVITVVLTLLLSWIIVAVYERIIRKGVRTPAPYVDENETWVTEAPLQVSDRRPAIVEESKAVLRAAKIRLFSIYGTVSFERTVDK